MKNSNCLKNVWAQVQLKINNANSGTFTGNPTNQIDTMRFNG